MSTQASGPIPNPAPPNPNSNDSQTESPIVRTWNKLLTIFKYFFLSFIILTILEILLAYWLVSSRWHLLLSNDEMMEYAERVKEAEPMPENFMRIYGAIFPNHVNTSLTKQVFVNYGTRFLFRHTELDDKPHCFCDMVYDIQRKKHQELEDLEWDGRLQDLEFGFGIEKYASPESCFNYVMQFRVPEVLDHLPANKYGHLKGKSIAEMTDDELIELILLMKSRSRYSRHKNPEKFEKALQHYRDRVNENLAQNN